MIPITIRSSIRVKACFIGLGGLEGLEGLGGLAEVWEVWKVWEVWRRFGRLFIALAGDGGGTEGFEKTVDEDDAGFGLGVDKFEIFLR